MKAFNDDIVIFKINKPNFNETESKCFNLNNKF